jgi:hypothetical protein
MKYSWTNNLALPSGDPVLQEKFKKWKEEMLRHKQAGH